MSTVEYPLGMPKGSVRAIAFLSMVFIWGVCNIAMVVGAIWGPVTVDQLLKWVTIITIPPLTGAFGFYFGQKVGQSNG